MDKQIEDMAAMSGESMQTYRYDVPNVSMHGNTGEYALFEDDEVKPLEDPFDVIVLKVRRKLEGKDARKNDYYSQEFNSFGNTVKLTINEGDSFNSLGEKTVKEWRNEHDFLKVRDVIYYVEEIDGPVKKLKIKGGSAGNWFDYLARLKEEDLHTFMVTTTLSKEKKEGSEGNEYYAMTFDHKPHGIDLSKVKERMVEIVTELNKVDASQKGGSMDVDSTIRELQADTDEIDPDSIPF